jgi:hypothetical protein
VIELKIINREAVPSALEMAKRYRLLHEPQETESICLDILEVEPDNQEALITMLLALTDNFTTEMNPSFDKARELVNKLNSQYCKAYYSGIIYEQRAKAHLTKGSPGSGQVAYTWFSKALESYGIALNSCDPDNQDAVLRWNSCARLINGRSDIKPGEGNDTEMLLDSFDTPH